MRQSTEGEGTATEAERLPFVGRTRESAQVLAEFERTAESTSCRRCTIVGGPGAGKSRLIEEVTESLDGVQVLRTQCRSQGETAVFEPLAATVEQAAGVSSEPQPEVLARALKELLAPTDEAEVVIEQLSELLGIGDEPISLEGTFFGLKRVYEAAARRGPTIVVIEDLHLGAPTLLDALEAFTSGLLSVPIFLLCSARVELLDARPEWGVTTRSTSAITLGPLETGAVRELISARAGGSLPDAVESRIVDASGGNPFFAEEIVDSLIEAGSLEPSEGGPVFTGDVEAISLPRSVEGLIVQQLDALTPEEREVLEAAAVVGDVFTVESLEGLFSGAKKAPLRSLMKLSRAGLVQTHASDVLGEDRFRFRHALVRETTYKSSPDEVRAAHHHAWARHLETHAGSDGEAEMVVGFHLEQAALLSRNIDLGFAQEEHLSRAAATHLGAAGLRALERSDFPTAHDLLSRAISLRPNTDPDALRLQLYLVEVLIEVGDLSGAQALARHVADGAGKLRDRGLEARGKLASVLVGTYQGHASSKEAARLARTSISLFTSLGDHLGLTRARQVIAEAHWDEMQYAATGHALETALASARQAGSWRDQVRILSSLSSVVFWGPAPVDEGLRRAQEIMDLSRGDRRVQAMVTSNVAGLEAMRKRFDTARTLARQAKVMFRELGSNLKAAAITHLTGMVEMSAGDHEAAEREFREGVVALGAMGEEILQQTSRIFLARALFMQGRHQEADELIAPLERIDDPGVRVDWASLKARILALRGEFRTAEALGREAVEASEDSDGLRMRGDVLTGLAEVMFRAGRSNEAHNLISGAIDLYRLKGDLASEDSAHRVIAAFS